MATATRIRVVASATGSEQDTNGHGASGHDGDQSQRPGPSHHHQEPPEHARREVTSAATSAHGPEREGGCPELECHYTVLVAWARLQGRRPHRDTGGRNDRLVGHLADVWNLVTDNDPPVDSTLPVVHTVTDSTLKA